MSPGLIGPQLELAIVSPSPPLTARPTTEADRIAQDERRYRRMLARKQKQGDLAGMAACYIGLGDLLLGRGDSEEAGEYYRHALALSREAHESRQARART